jgi:hypothetical protein
MIAAASLVATLLIGQFDPPGLTAKSRNYHAYRLFENTPSYGLTKVNWYIKKHIVKTNSGDSDNPVEAISNNAFSVLTTAEKFTYCVIHPENSTQNCDGMPAFLGEEALIFSNPSEPYYGEGMWSDRQNEFFTTHRGTVIRLTGETARRQHRFGANLKKIVTDLDAYELIPQMVAMYRKDRKDLDLLSTMAVLMKHDKYPPFVHSTVYKSLYGDKDSYQAHIPATVKNRDIIVKGALAFYKTRIHH